MYVCVCACACVVLLSIYAWKTNRETRRMKNSLLVNVSGMLTFALVRWKGEDFGILKKPQSGRVCFAEQLLLGQVLEAFEAEKVACNKKNGWKRERVRERENT